MKRVAYVIDLGLFDPSDGVTQKIGAQVDAWRSLGHDVNPYALRGCSTSSCVAGGEIMVQSDPNGSLPLKLTQYRRAACKLAQRLNEDPPDIIYTRALPYSPRLFPYLRRFAPYVIELNTLDREEWACAGFLRNLYNKLTRKRVYKNALGFVAVTQEIESNYSGEFNKPSVTIANGISTQFYRTYTRSAIEPAVAFVATGDYPWHGTDKLLTIASSLPDVPFHVIGNIRLNSPPNNLTLHGPKSQKDAAQLTSRCTLGISTLALHRKGMDEACPLKTRQYLSQGLSVIVAYDDTDLRDQELPFVLRIPNTESNVNEHMEEICTFIRESGSIPTAVALTFAEEHLDHTAKEKTRMAFLQEILKTRERHG